MNPAARLIAAIALALGTAALPVHAAAPPGHEHDHAAAAASASLQLDHGKKWVTDAPLRESMAGLRDAVRGAPAPLHKGTASPAEYAAFGQRVESAVGRIVRECKLPPAADAQLHLVVADLIAGADAMKAARDGKAGRAGLVRVNGAVEAYAKHFDHPGWGAARP